MMRRRQRIIKRGRTRGGGQSTLEYLLVIIAVLLAILFAVNGVIQPHVHNQINVARDGMDRGLNELNRLTQQ